MSGNIAQLTAQQQAVTLATSAQLLALNVTPITIVPAQGAGTAIIVDEVIYSYTHVTTDYDTGSQGAIFYGDPASHHLAGNTDNGISTATVNSGASYLLISTVSNGSAPAIGITRALAENQSIEFGAPTSGGSPTVPYTGGDGTMTVTVVYRVLAL